LASIIAFFLFVAYFGVAHVLGDGLWILSPGTHVNLLKIHKGTESGKVRSVLGEPYYRFDAESIKGMKTLPQGYPVPERDVSGELWVYFEGVDLAVFVYFDSSMLVEGKIVEGS